MNRQRHFGLIYSLFGKLDHFVIIKYLHSILKWHSLYKIARKYIPKFLRINSVSQSHIFTSNVLTSFGKVDHFLIKKYSCSIIKWPNLFKIVRKLTPKFLHRLRSVSQSHIFASNVLPSFGKLDRSLIIKYLHSILNWPSLCL
jgi:hypothetical protein